MIKTKFNNFFKRLAAFILVLITLSSAMSVTSFAGDSTFLETLINTEKYTYVANLTSDTKTKQRKYAYKYMNMAYVLGKGCSVVATGTSGSESTSGLNTADQQKDPNYCFRLNTEYYYAKTSEQKSLKGNAQLNSGTALDLYFLMEGYAVKDSTSMITDDTKINTAATGKQKNINKSKVTKTTSPLSYPGYWNETVTTEQSEYAQETLIELVASLNGILATVNDGNRFESVADLVNKSIMIRPDSSNNVVKIVPQLGTNKGYKGYVIVYSDLTNVATGLDYETSTGQANRQLSKWKNSSGGHTYAVSSVTNSSTFLNALNLPRANADKGLYAYVFPIDNKNTTDESDDVIVVNDASVFVYAKPKGFTEIKSNLGVFQSPMFTDKGEIYNYAKEGNQEDTPWISIHMLSMYANTVYKQHNISVTTYVEPDSNLFSKLIAGIFTGILWVIRSVLGLADIDTLVFNLGQRGSAAYNFGLMSENWWNVVLQYQLIFQAIAWVILVCGFIKTLIDLNLSTINPQTRMSVYETIQKFIVVGIGLVILIPAVQFLLECNDTLVELFASQVETSALNMPAVNNVLVQFLVGMMWITILLYINFIYIMRSITVALLIASGPFFISTIAFSRGGKSGLFVNWAKELLANIFVQSVHAFVLSFLVQLLASGTFLETFAIAISIIPITEMFRNLIFAGAGGSTSQMANTAAGAMNRMGTAVGKGLMAAGGAAITGIAGGSGGGPENGGGGEGGKSGGSSGGGKGSGVASLISSAAQKKLGQMGDGTSKGAAMAKSMADKKGLDSPTKGMKALGATRDIAGVAGLAMGAAATEFGAALPDIQQGLADLALKGDYSGLGKTMDNVATAQGKMVGGTVAGGAAAASAAKKRNVESTGQAVNTSSTQQMGASTIGQTAKNQGQNDSGGTIQPPALTGSKEVYSRSNTTNTQDLSGSSTEAQAQAYAHFSAGDNKKVKDALAFNADGSTTKGKEYSYTYTDDKGQTKNGSFFVAGNGVSSEVKEKAETATAQHPAGLAGGQTRAIARKESIAAASTKTGREGEQATTAMKAMSSKEDVTGKYFDADGKAIEGGSIVKGADGGLTYVDKAVMDDQQGTVARYTDNAIANDNAGATYAHNAAEYAQYLTTAQAGKENSGAYAGTKDASGVYDLTSQTSTGAFTDRAMISAVGEAVKNQPGVYTLGGQTFNTGLTQAEGQSILRSRGINGVQTTSDVAGTGQAGFTYHQHTPKSSNTAFVGTQKNANGHPIAQYATGIDATGQGKNGAPTWNSDGKGGGTMKFSNQQAAVSYFQKQGNVETAEAIAAVGENGSHTYGSQTFENNGSNGFTVSFDGQALAKQGTKMEIGGNGTDMYVSSSDGQAKDPFALDHSSPMVDNRATADQNTNKTTTAQNVGDQVPNE